MQNMSFSLKFTAVSVEVGMLRGIKLSRVCVCCPRHELLKRTFPSYLRPSKCNPLKKLFSEFYSIHIIANEATELRSKVRRRQIHNAAQCKENLSSYLYTRLLKRDGNWERIPSQ